MHFLATPFLLLVSLFLHYPLCFMINFCLFLWFILFLVVRNECTIGIALVQMRLIFSFFRFPLYCHLLSFSIYVYLWTFLSFHLIIKIHQKIYLYIFIYKKKRQKYFSSFFCKNTEREITNNFHKNQYQSR